MYLVLISLSKVCGKSPWYVWYESAVLVFLGTIRGCATVGGVGMNRPLITIFFFFFTVNEIIPFSPCKRCKTIKMVGARVSIRFIRLQRIVYLRA